MGTEIRFIVSYACPHCRASLEGRSERAGTWLRCPGCGRASRPPALALVVADRPPPVPFAAGDEDLIIGPAPSLRPMTPVAVNRGDGPADDGPDVNGDETPSLNPWRVVLTTALFVSVTMLLFAYLDRSPYGILVFSATTVLFLVLLVIPVRSGD